VTTTLQNFIDGRWTDSASTEHLTLRNPATEEVLALVPAGSADDVDAAVAAATRAQRDWSALPLEERLGYLERAADTLDAHIAEIADLECLEMGRPASVGLTWIGGAVGRLRLHASLAREYPFAVENPGDTATTLVRRRPLGVVALIVPWNFQTNVIVAALGALLASGNTIVLKPSEKSPLSAIRLLELLEFPPGVLNLIVGDGRAGAPLAQHPGIALTHFTGSVGAGKAIAAASAGNLHRAVLELGGKDPVVVDSDVDIATTVKDIAYGAFSNSGQICTSMERIYVHRAIADRFIDALLEEARDYRYGDPSTGDVRMGPMVDAGQRKIVADHVDDAVAHGATVLLGGAVPEGAGYFYPATVLTDVTDDMVIMRDETFGPVAPIQVVDSFEEGLEKAGRTTFGLAATVYSNDPAHIEAAHDLPVGTVWINKWQGRGTNVVREPYGNSGMSASGHFASFDQATRAASVVRTS
jgi:succinate-semialdehyde dehydrogenase/glutarate-semialdehyde dehydrogenase